MTKKKQKKLIGIEYAGLGFMTVLGFFLGLAFFLLLYNWYLTGYMESTSLIITAILLIVVMYIILIVATMIGKKYGVAYHKAIYVGIGFTIALIVAGMILTQLNLSTPTF